MASTRALSGAALLPVVAGSARPPDVSASSAAGPSRALLEQLEDEIPRLMGEFSVPGVSMVLVRRAEVVWRGAFGVRDATTRAPVDTDTVFPAESMSKPPFAYTALKLCETGTLDLDTPLTRFTPERVLMGDSRLELITARHVLSHTAGFQNWRSGREPLRIHFRPGERWLYSGEGYYYLQSVLTHLTGHVDPSTCGKYEGDLRVCATDVDEYLESHLLHPFGMASSGYVWNTVFEARATRTHDPQGTPLPPRRPTAIDAARYASSGGLWTTPTDYARFLIAIIHPTQADAFRLKRETIDEMVRPVVKVPEDPRRSSWALGWQVFQAECGTVLAHGGDGAGSHAFAYASREHESGLVIMTNGAGGWKLLSKLTQGNSVDRLLTA